MKYRLCTVKNKICYFHKWEQWSNVINVSPFVGEHSGGQISYVLGIVEFPDGSVRQVPPNEILFIDDTHDKLISMNKKEKKE